jgi:hypothetical protein
VTITLESRDLDVARRALIRQLADSMQAAQELLVDLGDQADMSDGPTCADARD